MPTFASNSSKPKSLLAFIVAGFFMRGKTRAKQFIIVKLILLYISAFIRMFIPSFDVINSPKLLTKTEDQP